MSDFRPKYLVLHDYGVPGGVNLSKTAKNPYHALVYPDGTIRYRNPANPYGEPAPHAYRLNPESIGLSYAGPVGGKPTPAAMEALRREYANIQKQFPGIQALSHGEAYARTRGTDQQASRAGRGLEEASWRTEVRDGQGQQIAQGTSPQSGDDVRSRLAGALVNSDGVTTTQPPVAHRPMAERSLTAFANVPKPMALGGEPTAAPPQESRMQPFETRTVRTIPMDRYGAQAQSPVPPQEDYRKQLASALEPRLIEGPVPAPRPERAPINTPAQPQMKPEDRSPIMNYGMGQPQSQPAQFSERPQLMDYATTLPNGTQTQTPPEWAQPTPTIKQDGMGAGWRDQPPMASGTPAPVSDTNAMLAKALTGGATWSQNPFGIKWRSGGFSDLGGR